MLFDFSKKKIMYFSTETVLLQMIQDSGNHNKI